MAGGAAVATPLIIVSRDPHPASAQTSCGPPASSTVADERNLNGTASNAGAATAYSRGDHTHGTAPLGNGVSSHQSYGQTVGGGTSTNPSREDHRHGTPSLGSAVISQQSYGQTPWSGASSFPSRDDHRHGTPLSREPQAGTHHVGLQANAIAGPHPGLVLASDRAGGDYSAGVIWAQDRVLKITGPVGANGHGRPALELHGNSDGSCLFQLYNDRDVYGAYGETAYPAERSRVFFDCGNQDTTTYDRSLLRIHTTAYRGGISVHAGGVAPVWKAVSDHESWQAWNNAGTAFIPVRGSAFEVWSERESKSNLRDLESASDKVARLRPVRFNRPLTPLTDGSMPEGSARRNGEADKLGLIADEVAEVVPEAVVWGADDKAAAIDYAMVVATLLKAHQELAEEVARLKGRR